ncbi:tRNA (34-2'-O)-methyltransferase regulator WDR6 isoform X2 [Parasteatoda tepidariorum]|uniref:tRNA (34-2'-O)-methyltransferase regulator WDR6 isoform X2 n=1 Tax=Parasteatoda tepidariorum TaxID=114398 RepID=UPI00077FCD13|nr:WD repeat-containing protein 6 isoform X2 [Parasteatoda tepidariorum]
MESNISDWSDGFQRISLCTHITALKLFKNFLFVAESNEIQIYDWKLRELLWKSAIFDSCTIHGIRISDNHKFLAFGAKHIRVLSFILDAEISLTHSHAINLKDWILDVQWICKKEEIEYTVAALTAHNCLILLNESGEILQSYHCAENCILYSASIISCEYHSLVLAVGTVFQKILIWSPFSNQNDVSRNEPFHQLSGHQGVIFSVTYNEQHKIICSTSDDRSLRVWKVHSKDQFASSLEFWRNSTIESIYVLYAHESRVWRSLILNSCILSIGEDSFICVWSLEGTLLKKFKGHKNGSIWCIETTVQDNNLNQENIFAFTGGSDGGVYIWGVSQALQSNLISQLSQESNIFQSLLNNPNADNAVSHLPPDRGLKKNKCIFPRLCSLYTEGDDESILIYMGTEKLSKYNLKTKMWDDVFLDYSITNYCIMSISSGSSYIALGTFDGELILIHRQELSDKRYKKLQAHDSMICSLHWCSKTGDALLSCGTEGHLTLWRVSYEEEFEVQCLQKFFLPKCKGHWWSTTALHISSDTFLVVGDRGGSVSAYSYSVELDENNEMGEPFMRFNNIHGDNGVTDIQEHNLFYYSSGRDGKVNQYSWIDEDFKLLHTLKVSHDLEWIGKMIFYESHLLLVGFHTKNFVVWSSHLESAVMTVECGGGHRSWDFSLTEEGMATFVAIQKKDIIYYQQDLRHMIKESVLKDGLSGQKICCLTYLYTQSSENQDPWSILLCGGEDNTLQVIKLTYAPDGTAEFVTLSKLSGHLSNIRAIDKEKMLNIDYWLLASVGGRSQLILWKYYYDTYGDYAICQQLKSTLLMGSSENSMLKFRGSDPTESQTRLMDVSISRASGNTVIDNWNNHYDIGVACSDGYFRLYNFDIDENELTIKHSFKHNENCILKLVSDRSNLVAATQQISYIIGATNGSLKVLQHDNLHGEYLNMIEAEDMKNSHQSGINALDYRFLVASVWMICSGGDDNSLMVAFIDFKALPSVKNLIKVVSKYHISNAHASQITGVKILDPFTIVSTSVDQRLNVWKVNYINSPTTAVTINLHRSVISLIPDIANLEYWENSDFNEWNLAVCGQGFEVFRFTKEDDLDFKELILHFIQDPYPYLKVH